MRHQREVLGYKELQCQIKPWNRVLTEQAYPRYPWHCVMLPAETFYIRKRPLFHSLAKAKNNASKQFRPFFFWYIVKGNVQPIWYSQVTLSSAVVLCRNSNDFVGVCWRVFFTGMFSSERVAGVLAPALAPLHYCLRRSYSRCDCAKYHTRLKPKQCEP